jgi:hypothetical protein
MKKHSLDIDYVLYLPLILELSAELSWDACAGTNTTTPRLECHCGMDYHAFPPSAPLSAAIANRQWISKLLHLEKVLFEASFLIFN